MLCLYFNIQNWDLVGRRVNDVLKGFPRLRLTHGRKVRANFLTCLEQSIIAVLLKVVSFVLGRF